MSKINLINFKTVIMKATLNNSIETLQLIFEDGKIKSKMVSKDSQAITQLKIPNDVINDQTDYIVFNYNEPYTEILPFIDLIESEEADINISEEKVRITDGPQKIDLHFCAENIVKIFTGDEVKIETEQKIITTIDDNFLDGYEKAKRVAARFKKIYFNVKDNVLSMEASDKTNMFTNKFKFTLMQTNEMTDFTVCFDFRNFVNLMKIVTIEPEKFEIGFLYVESQELGLMQAISLDGSEKYFLMGRNF